MAADDNPTPDRRLPRRVEEALARARRAAGEADKSADGRERPPRQKSSRILALVPLTVAVVFFALLMPRATAPDAVPVPLVDERALGATIRADDQLAERARGTRLPTDVLAVGSGIRALQAAQTKGAPDNGGSPSSDTDLELARVRLEEARRGLVTRAGWEEDLLALRAVQMRGFLDEVRRYEATGTVSKELEELGGAFVRRMTEAGWIEGQTVLLDDAQRRVAFKIVWNAIAMVDALPTFQPTLDEQRALYTLYLTRPHPPEPQLRSLEAQRRSASTPEACERAAVEERRAREIWRADKIRKLGAIDPTYPTGYALGVAQYRAGRYDLSAEAFRAWIDAHPDGAYATRARNHLKAALAAQGSI